MTLQIRYRLARGAFRLDVDIRVPAAGVTAIMGSTGSGKTTLLRCIAGLEPDARGLLAMPGMVWQDEKINLPCHRRNIGYVAQEPGLFNHKSVDQNLRYGLQRGGGGPGGQAEVEKMAGSLGISHLLNARAGELSGGETRRVALARALLAGPRLLLMDEPLANQDDARRGELLDLLETAIERLAIPVIYVSHNPGEVRRLASMLVIMDAGRASEPVPVSAENCPIAAPNAASSGG